jgi:hypothetical protein
MAAQVRACGGFRGWSHPSGQFCIFWRHSALLAGVTIRLVVGAESIGAAARIRQTRGLPRAGSVKRC